MTSPQTSSSSSLSAAIARIEADYLRSADTHLIPLPLPEFAARGIDFYLKDESTHPTDSLKHRLARGEQGSILSLLCDSGERYLPTYYNANWVAEKMGDCTAANEQINRLMRPAQA